MTRKNHASSKFPDRFDGSDLATEKESKEQYLLFVLQCMKFIVTSHIKIPDSLPEKLRSEKKQRAEIYISSMFAALLKLHRPGPRQNTVKCSNNPLTS